MSTVIDLFMHMDAHLNHLVEVLGLWFYGAMFLVVFCETGLVVTPILPGDSLLFAVGALAASAGSQLDIGVLAAVFASAALCGDLTNYAIGRRVGPRIFHAETSWLLNRKHLDETRAFYGRHGGKTIILARFIPIVRTFAPFVAGIGRMPLRRFLTFSVTASVLWIGPFLFGGYLLGNVPAVKTNFHIAVVAIVLISVAPAVVQVVRARRAAHEDARRLVG